MTYVCFYLLSKNYILFYGFANNPLLHRLDSLHRGVCKKNGGDTQRDSKSWFANPEKKMSTP